MIVSKLDGNSNLFAEAFLLASDEQHVVEEDDLQVFIFIVYFMLIIKG
jgi:hypothetical protein